MPPCPIVQLTGQSRRPTAGTCSTGALRGPDRRGTAHVFYAPMILDDAETAAAIRRQADVADALALASP